MSQGLSCLDFDKNHGIKVRCLCLKLSRPSWVALDSSSPIPCHSFACWICSLQSCWRQSRNRTCYLAWSQPCSCPCFLSSEAAHLHLLLLVYACCSFSKAFSQSLYNPTHDCQIKTSPSLCSGQGCGGLLLQVLPAKYPNSWLLRGQKTWYFYLVWGKLGIFIKHF